MCLSSQLNVTCVKYIPLNSCMSLKNWILADSCQAGYHEPRRGSHQVSYSDWSQSAHALVVLCSMP
jgi:hypothetical protein